MINTDRKDRGTNEWVKCPDCRLYRWADMYFFDAQEYTCQYCGYNRLEGIQYTLDDHPKHRSE